MTIFQSSLLCARYPPVCDTHPPQVLPHVFHSLILPLARVAAEDQTTFCLYWVPEQCCFFFGVRLLASRPTPNLEDQGVFLCLGFTLRPVRHGRPYQ